MENGPKLTDRKEKGLSVLELQGTEFGFLFVCLFSISFAFSVCFPPSPLGILEGLIIFLIFS